MYKRYRLNNGSAVICHQIDGVKSFAIGVYVKACSNYETSREIGISHLIEHMMFKGTKKYSAKQIAEKIDDVGGVLNAYTAKDCTAYYAKVLSEHAPLAIELLADMLTNSQFLKADLSKEIQVVKEEIAMYQDSPEDVAYELLQTVAYGKHPLALPILGYADSLDSLTREAIVDYIGRYYTADNTIIAVAGDLPADLIDQLNAAFADYRQRGQQGAVAAAEFLAGYDFIDKDIEQNHICLGFNGIPYGHADYYTYLLISNVLGGTSSSLLFQNVREKHGLAYSIYSQPSFFKQAGHFTIYTSYRAQNQLAVASAIVDCLIALKSHFDEAVLARAKTQLKSAYILGLESSTSIMGAMGKRLIYDAKVETIEQMMAAIDNIRLSDVNRCIAALNSSKIALAMVGRLNEADVKAVYQLFCNGVNNES